MVVARVVLPGWGVLEEGSIGGGRSIGEEERGNTGSWDAGNGY